MRKNISGLELSRAFSEELIRPLLNKHFPKLKYSTALVGYGSEVLGYDTSRSRDHAWGPRAFIFLKEQDYARHKLISRVLSKNLPYSFKGYYTHFGKPDEHGVRHMERIKSGLVNHKAEVFTVKGFYKLRFGINLRSNLKSTDWLLMPQQKLLEFIKGDVFYDGTGELSKLRKQLHYFPKDVWLYILASGWQKISQEEAFVGRTGGVKDELGSQIIASRLVEELMRLCFLMEKKYFPYSKWFGSAFMELKCSPKLSPIFRKVFLAKSWQEREKHLIRAYSIIAEMHNKLGITRKLPTKAVKYYDRPFYVIRAEIFAKAIGAQIKDKKLRKLMLIGSVDQFTDSSSLPHMTSIIDSLKLHLTSISTQNRFQ